MKRIIKQGFILLSVSTFYFACTDIDIIDVYQKAIDGPKATVKIMISTAFQEGDQTRSTADDLNEGTVLQPIENAIIAAYISDGTLTVNPQDRSYNALEIGTIDLGPTRNTSRVMEVPVGTVSFLFYGNGTSANWSGPESMSQGKYITDVSFNLENGPHIVPNTSQSEYYQKPASLLYWSATPNQTIEENGTQEQIIDLTTVHYGVGNLVTVVKDATVDEGNISLIGVMIGNQPKKVSWNFTPINYNQNKVVIYDDEMNLSGSAASGYLPKQYPETLTPFTVNNYTLVFPTPSTQDVPVSLIVRSTSDIELSNGVTALAGTWIHLPVVTIKAASATETGLQVFKSDYKTITRFSINTLKNGDVVPQPLITANVRLDIVVNTSWKQGAMIDYEVL